MKKNRTTIKDRYLAVIQEDGLLSSSYGLYCVLVLEYKKEHLDMPGYLFNNYKCLLPDIPRFCAHRIGKKKAKKWKLRLYDYWMPCSAGDRIPGAGKGKLLYDPN